MKSRTMLWIVLCLSLPAALSAGTVITMKEQTAQGSSNNKLYLDGGRLRLESAAGGRNHVILYHAANGGIQVLDPLKKTWFELPAGGDQQAAATKAVMARKDLSEARKKQVLDNMKANAERHGLFGGQPVPAHYRKVAAEVKVNGFVTDEYEVTRNGAKVREVWLVSPKSLEIDHTDVVALQSLAERLGAQPASPGPPGLVLETGAPEGVPVRIVTWDNGKPQATTDVTAVSHEAAAAPLFDVPKDYKPASPGAPGAPAPPGH
ncbi:MAG TPA: DUF4412 domain-containing protein [Thermoanaerobaculia bacterium]|nr:DUF4412 domain-containing protein [Thermoanaerobaculia bacterium]